MNVFKKIVTILLSFILMLGIVSSTLLVIINNGVNKDNLFKRFEKINLYNSVYEEVRNGFENYIYQSGLDIEIIDKICTREKVKSDIKTVINAMYDGSDVEIDSSEIRSNLDKAINEYIEKQGRKLSLEEEKNIDKFEDLIEESYKEEIALYQKGSNKISGSLSKAIGLMTKLIMVSVGVAALSLIFLVIINGKSLLEAGAYVGISLFSSGLILAITNALVHSKVDVDNLVLFTKSLSSIIIDILNSVLSTVQVFGIWYIVFGIFVIIASETLILLEKKY